MANEASNQVIVPFYLPDQYPMLLEMAEDAELLEEKWEVWYQNYLEFKHKMKKKGIECLELIVDVEEMNNYCIMNDLKNIDINRTLYVQKFYQSL